MEQTIIADALDNLRVHQRQLDMDGVEVAVSRQALCEVLIGVESALSAALPLTAPPAQSTAWHDMVQAPKDGTMLRLLVQPGLAEDDGWTPFADSSEPYVTVGFNALSDTGEDEWQFAGWDWSHDCFTDGAGTVIGWQPFDALTAPPARGQVEVKALEWRGSEGVWAKADALFGATYRITEYAGMAKPFKLETVGFVGPSGHYELLNEGKAAAQADYERRILSALTSPAEPAPAKGGVE